MSDDMEKKLQLALHNNVSKIVANHAAKENVTFTKEFVHDLTCATLQQIKSSARDVDAFRMHASRVKINASDVKLLARKNPSLHLRLECLSVKEEYPIKKSRKKEKEEEPAKKANMKEKEKQKPSTSKKQDKKEPKPDKIYDEYEELLNDSFDETLLMEM